MWENGVGKREMGIFPNNVKINEKAQTANFSDLTKQCQELDAIAQVICPKAFFMVLQKIQMAADRTILKPAAFPQLISKLMPIAPTGETFGSVDLDLWYSEK